MMLARTRSLGCALLAGAALLLAGCAAEPRPSIETIGQLGAAYLDAGGTCSELVEQYRESDEDPVVASCGDETELILAATPDEAQAVATERQLQEQTVLVSDRWVIRDPDVVELQQQLGGEIVTLAPAAGPANMADALVLTADGALEREPVAAGEAPEPLTAADGRDVLVVVDPTCEYCARLLDVSGEQLEQLAADGEARVAFLPVALSDSIENGFASTLGANAVACVANVAPNAAPAFLRELLGVLVGERFDAETVAALAAEHVGDADVASTGDCITEGTFVSWVRAATQRALTEPLQDVEPLHGVPTVIADGVTFSGDVSSPEALAAFLAEPTATP